MNDKLSMNKGMLYENVVAQMLSANGRKLYFYTHYDEFKKRNDIEIDFLLPNESKLNFKIYPIEVKSSKNYTVLSFDRSKSRVAKFFIIHPKNLSIDGNIIRYPAYMTFCIMP